MDKLVIEWGNLERTEALEELVNQKATKVLRHQPDATKLIVTFQITNPVSSAGEPSQKVSMELRKPNHQDVRASKEGPNAYSLISETERALLSQVH